MNWRDFVLLAFCCCGGLAGCERQGLQAAPPGKPTVPVSRPIQKQITDYVDFTGRAQAVQSVNVVARVTGYLVKEPFKEGSDVKAGDLLFEIDPRPYQAQYDQAVGQVNLYQAQLKLAQVTLNRDQQLQRNAPGSVSAQQVDQDLAAVAEAEAQVKAAKASLEVYKLNLDFCRVTSPIDGQVSRYYITPGNLVTQDQTLLTTVVSLDPMYVYFDVDEPTVLRVRRAINEGKIVPYANGQIPLLMGLQDEDDKYPHKGNIDFANNQVNPTTGSILVRGVFPNPLPKAANPRRLLMQGMYVRIRVPIGQPHPALLVIDQAIGSDQGLKFVNVVNAEGKVERRDVATGPLEDNGLRVVTEGLKADDLVVINGLQQIHPGQEVGTALEPMPTLAGLAARRAEMGAGALPAGSLPAAGGTTSGGTAASGAAGSGTTTGGGIKAQSSAAGSKGAPRK